MRISDVPGHLRSWKPCQKIPPQSIWCFTVSVTISEWFHTVLLAGVEVIQEHVVKKPLLTLAISKLTDYYKVETSHWVPRLIRYRSTLLAINSSHWLSSKFSHVANTILCIFAFNVTYIYLLVISCFIHAQMFSIGLRSGEFHGLEYVAHFISLRGFSHTPLCTGAPSL